MKSNLYIVVEKQTNVVVGFIDETLLNLMGKITLFKTFKVINFNKTIKTFENCVVEVIEYTVNSLD